MRFSLSAGAGASRDAGGRYTIHCHTRPHEDHDMMQQFTVGDPAVNESITAVPRRVGTGSYDDGRVDDSPA